VPPQRHGYGQEGVVVPRVGRLPEASAPGTATRLALAGRGGGAARRGGSLELAGLPGRPGLDAAPRAPYRDASRAGRLARLGGFVRYLVRAGVLEDERSIGTFIGGHRLQKYLYIAQELGMLEWYRFDFMKIGAFSTDLAADIGALGRDGAVPEAFDAEPGVSGAFVDLVRGRDPEWLQVATFALRGRREPGSLGQFVEDMRRLEYDAHTARGALAAVASAAGAGEGNGDGTA